MLQEKHRRRHPRSLVEASLRVSSNALIADPDSISFSVVAGGDVVDHIVNFGCDISCVGGRANKFGVEAGADVYSIPGRSRSALGTNGGNRVVALIDSPSRFLERSHCICRLSISCVSRSVQHPVSDARTM